MRGPGEKRRRYRRVGERNIMANGRQGSRQQNSRHRMEPTLQGKVVRVKGEEAGQVGQKESVERRRRETPDPQTPWQRTNVRDIE